MNGSLLGDRVRVPDHRVNEWKFKNMAGGRFRFLSIFMVIRGEIEIC
jgi:hypothetical protein